MKTQHFLLLHGSWHGAWCWYKVAPRLRATGAVVTVPNLPGRGADRRHAARLTLAASLRSLEPVLNDDEPVVVVAHSRSGVLATALAEQRPRAVSRVVYVAAYHLQHGERAADAFRADRESLLRPHVVVDRLAMRDALAPAIWREGLYADCGDEDVALSSSLLCAEPSWSALTRVTRTARAASVPASFIRLTEDRAISIAQQDRMLSRLPPDRVESLRASHSAYFSQPDALTATILKTIGS